MIRIACRTVSMLFAVLLAACATPPTDRAPAGYASGSQKAAAVPAPLFPDLDAWLAQNRMSINAGGARTLEYERAFAQGAVIAYGEGFPAAGAEGPGQRRLTALRAAEVVAMRNLAEFFARYATAGEIRFNTYTVRQEAFLKGAYVVAGEYDPERERAAVLLKLDLRGAKGFAR